MLVAALVLGAALSITGCSEADKVNFNMSKQADYFEYFHTENFIDMDVKP